MRSLISLFIIILILSFFGISIRGILTSPTGRDNLTFIYEIVHTGFQILAGYITLIVHNFQAIFGQG